MGIKDYLRGLLDLVLPRYCAACGKVLLRKEKFLCLGCETGLPLTYFWKERHNAMADKLNEKIHQTIGVGEYEAYSYAAALFFYKGDFENLTRGVKYHGNVALGTRLGALLGDKLQESAWWADVDMIIPVPLHRWRRFKRGYNQAEIIAGGIVESLNRQVGDGENKCIMDNSMLVRKRRTKSQTTLSVSEKAANVSGAFEFIPSSLEGKPPKHILLTDDVCTTGSTLCECHRELRKGLVSIYGEAGRKIRISVATLAYVGE